MVRSVLTEIDKDRFVPVFIFYNFLRTFAALNNDMEQSSIWLKK